MYNLGERPPVVRYTYDFTENVDQVFKGYLDKYKYNSMYEHSAIVDVEQQGDNVVCLTRRFKGAGTKQYDEKMCLNRDTYSMNNTLTFSDRPWLPLEANKIFPNHGKATLEQAVFETQNKYQSTDDFKSGVRRILEIIKYDHYFFFCFFM